MAARGARSDRIRAPIRVPLSAPRIGLDIGIVGWGTKASKGTEHSSARVRAGQGETMPAADRRTGERPDVAPARRQPGSATSKPTISTALRQSGQVGAITALQRSAGNAAVARLLASSGRVGPVPSVPAQRVEPKARPDRDMPIEQAAASPDYRREIGAAPRSATASGSAADHLMNGSTRRPPAPNAATVQPAQATVEHPPTGGSGTNQAPVTGEEEHEQPADPMTVSSPVLVAPPGTSQDLT